MPTEAAHREIQTLDVRQEIRIAAPVEVSFQALLEELGPGSELPDGTPFPMKIEPRPGGRWYRDLGDDAGHLWGHVQVIKPPSLLELTGPMFMSYPAVSHVQYRLTPEGEGTLLKLVHRAFGQIPPDDLEGVDEGWSHGLGRVRQIAERKAASAHP
ncbi:MAG: SRPBCC domain-containing protein [Phycisphaerales bacterium]|nr:MAG: SRPBCC domain-containing protein [Phycisphaerales bacterium]